LRATKVLSERLAVCKNIEPVWNSVVAELKGDKKVTSVVVNNVGARHALPLHLPCDGVFIFAGITPNSEVAKGLAKTDIDGYIITDEHMKTSCEGMFACGDVRKKPLWQIVTACGEAATAAVSAQHYIEGLKGTAYI
jgi:thioredoxin reductase (NADPH)